MALVFKSLQVVLPGALVHYLPALLFGQHLEDAVLSGLVPVVSAIVGLLLVLDLAILRSPDQSLPKQIAEGVLGLVLGSMVFHVAVVLFGAPVVDASNSHELYLVCSSIGAMLGAYVGALPIPLDWDRPWQQWPLTCVYGTLIGHAAGIVLSIVISTTSESFAAKSTKKD
ncbi:hypothetical protein AM588_10008480 [Phytophthora nicotianae]|uniref:Uncharacterized protein n=1 Tax=Phytophthora nicotianae TaxID=4792 RepID=A0A0W8DM07_PHYNI|nr:hypothetical protein AM588_10008480 [Phytophthora nicotianae]